VRIRKLKEKNEAVKRRIRRGDEVDLFFMDYSTTLTTSGLHHVDRKRLLYEDLRRI
jgi:hypothetical protein